MTRAMNGTARWTLAAALVLVVAAPVTAADGVDARAAFETLKTLEGTWTGTPEAQGLPEDETPPEEMTLEFRVSAAGHVVMETMAPKTEHEMINMYHLDGEDLLVTHYCSSGNQPRMRLDRTRSSGSVLVFDFLDATNLDAATEGHIHSLRLEIGEDGLESSWTSFQGGEPSESMTLHLTRSR